MSHFGRVCWWYFDPLVWWHDRVTLLQWRILNKYWQEKTMRAELEWIPKRHALSWEIKGAVFVDVNRSGYRMVSRMVTTLATSNKFGADFVTWLPEWLPKWLPKQLKTCFYGLGNQMVTRLPGVLGTWRMTSLYIYIDLALEYIQLTSYLPCVHTSFRSISLFRFLRHKPPILMYIRTLRYS